MKNPTVLIHTFKRPEALERLLSSIKGYDIVVYDDSDHDRGLSWGRNYLVSKAVTPFVFICDDDCIFTEKTDLRLAEKLMGDNDILGIDCGITYSGRYVTEGDTVRMVNGDPLEFVPNIFLARRESLLNHKWDEDLKMGEHTAFFYTHRGKLKISKTNEVSIDHRHVFSPDYNDYRQRAGEYVNQWMRKNNIKKLIDIHGGERVI